MIGIGNIGSNMAQISTMTKDPVRHRRTNEIKLLLWRIVNKLCDS